MLDALTLTKTFVACGCWRYVTQNWLEQSSWWDETPKLIRMFLHYYSIVFAGFLVLVWDNVSATWHGVASYGFANPALFLTNASSINITCPNDIVLSPLQWSSSDLREVRFDANGISRMLVLGSCPAVVLTQVVGWCHIFKHWLRIKNSEKVRLCDNILRDRSIQIMFLPVIYSIVAYNNVIRLMNLFTGSLDVCRTEWTLGFHEKKTYTLSLYESNLAMADFYEAVALYHFTALTTHHIKQTFLRERKNMMKAADRDKSIQRSFTQVEKQLEENDPVLRVTSVMSTLVTSGVMSFCFTCLLSFVHGLVLVFRIAFLKTNLEDTSSVPSMLSGAGLVASTVAIGFVVNVEVAFHHELSAFKPSLKFWSTKVIVSIAFIQEAALGLLGMESIMGPHHALSDLQIKLLYCSLLSYEVFAVTMLHVFAWPAGVNITSFERDTYAKARGVDQEEERREYWAEGETPHHGAGVNEPFLSVE